MSATVTRPPLGGVGAPPPSSGVEDGGGGGAGWVQLLRAANDIEAHLLAGRLNEAGVDVQVLKDRSAPGAWLYGGSNPWAPAVVMVRRLQLADARLVLAEISFEAPAAGPPRGSSTARNWRTPLLWWSLALGLGALMTGVGLARTPGTLSRCDLPLLCGDQVTNR